MADDPSLGSVFATVRQGAEEPIRALTAGLGELARSPEVAVLRHALKAAEAVSVGAGLLPPQEVRQALARLRVLADRLRREGIDPALGIANLVGDCLDGLDVLVATEAVPVPAELEELRLALARLRRPQIRLDLVLPADEARAALAGRLVRALVEDAEGLAEEAVALSELDAAVAEAVVGALRRTRAYDPRQSVEVHARLQGDLLTLEVVDRCPEEVTSEPAGASRRTETTWDVRLVRRVMDRVSYEHRDGRGSLRLRRRLRLWQSRRSTW